MALLSAFKLPVVPHAFFFNPTCEKNALTTFLSHQQRRGQRNQPHRTELALEHFPGPSWVGLSLVTARSRGPPSLFL